jgi:hypothetical protein
MRNSNVSSKVITVARWFSYFTGSGLMLDRVE